MSGPATPSTAGGPEANATSADVVTRATTWAQTSYRPWLLMAVATLLWLTRQPGLSVLQTIFIEDGPVFLQRANLDGAGAIVDPARGYLQVLPSAVGWVAASLPLPLASVVFALASAAVLFACMALVFVSLRESGPDIRRYALLAAVLLAVVPVASAETVGSVATSQFSLVAAGAMATAAGNIAYRRGIPFALFIVIAGVTTPLTFVLVPGVVWGCLRARRLGQGSVTALILIGLGTLIGLGLQMSGMVADRQEGLSATTGTTLAQKAESFAVLSGPLATWGKAPATALIEVLHAPVAILWLLSVVILVACLTYLVTTAHDRLWSLGTALALASGLGFLLVVLSVVVRPELALVSQAQLGGYRYPVPLGYIELVVLATTLVELIRRQLAAPRPSRGVAAWVLGTVLIVVVALGWATNLERAAGPAWAPELRTACTAVAPGEIVTVPTTGSGPGWTTDVRCP